uniref:Chromosome 1 open reading frame 174 n=1 Tax=Leptobrachium leishanense TaxID=445787 RepID=A0A8C5QAE0_9ANUR
MRNRKLTGGMRCSVRQENSSFSAGSTSSGHEAETCQPEKSARQVASGKGTEKRPLKKLKGDQNTMESDIHGLLYECDKKSSVPSSDHIRSAGAVVQPKKRVRKCPKKKVNVRTTASSFSNIKMSSNPGLTDNSGDGLTFVYRTRSEANKRKRNISVDSNIFIDEDSNQPMPLGRFFENADLMQDFPPVMASCASMSRREFRNLHYRAKEEDEEDDEEDEETMKKMFK